MVLQQIAGRKKRDINFYVKRNPMHFSNVLFVHKEQFKKGFLKRGSPLDLPPHTGLVSGQTMGFLQIPQEGVSIQRV